MKAHYFKRLLFSCLVSINRCPGYNSRFVSICQLRQNHAIHDKKYILYRDKINTSIEFFLQRVMLDEGLIRFFQLENRYEPYRRRL